jgi:BirA family biotin operon repressor/biotin-[acetyl-CoA-carboxylase] ligase
MIAYADSPDYAAKILGGNLNWSSSPTGFADPGLAELSAHFFQNRSIHSTEFNINDQWRYLFMLEKAKQSQYDVVVDLCKQNVELPEGVLCLAGSGEKHHGHHNRSWTALPGNIHLTAHFAPNLKMADAGIGFTILSAVSVIDAVDKIPGLEGLAAIKWVNDVFFHDAKVSGFLTHTLSMDGVATSAVIGIGLNVETTPTITPDRYISHATALKELVPDPEACNQQIVFKHLTESLAQNYRRLKAGGLPQMLDQYRERSMIIGREVEILPDPAAGSGGEIIRGKVVDIGSGLELILEGRATPITKGRLALKI